jgi:hypothetical protein
MISKNKELERDPFSFDIYLAYCASQGRMLCYDKPLVYSALDNISGKSEVSLTFKKENHNVYYFPEARIHEMKVYMKCLSELKLEKRCEKKVCMQLYKKTLVEVTKAYKHIMANEGICRHYGHETAEITYFNMLCNAMNVRHAFYETNKSKYSLFEIFHLEISMILSGLGRKIRKCR